MSETIDLPCGCRVHAASDRKNRLCPYHEGYLDGYLDGYEAAWARCGQRKAEAALSVAWSAFTDAWWQDRGGAD